MTSTEKGMLHLMSLVIDSALTFPEEVVLLSAIVDEQVQSGNGTVTEEFSKVIFIMVKTQR